jgi:bifunctional non-homologous end joining protein LigD
VLDGEAVGETFHAFDLLTKGAVDLRHQPYSIRYQELIDLVDPLANDALRYAPTASSEAQKRSLLQTLRAQEREGIVLKDSTAVYSPGRPASGGTQLKLKFYATASCIVSVVNKGRRSVALELIDRQGDRVTIGSVSIPVNQLIPAADQIVEVRYLYAYPGGSLFQPVYLGVREDEFMEECTVVQLKMKSSDSPES